MARLQRLGAVERCLEGLDWAWRSDRRGLCRRSARWRDGGVAAMRTARQGKPAQLGSAELAKIRGVLDRGAVVAGFDNDLWTLARIAQVIERVTGVAHHPGHVWRILKAMRWSLQRPARKAIERDGAKIARWVAEDWPQLVQTPERAEPGCVSSTNRE